MRALIGSMVLAALLFAPEASASFHFMQIEQAIGGVNGDASQQAVQLRMRFGGQNIVSQSRLRVVDAGGANAVLLIDMTTDVTDASAGARVLIATAEFAMAQGIVPDFFMANPIPPSYLAAGRIIFEADGGTNFWSLSWGGASYIGSNLGATTNDFDGNFGPPFANALPSTGLQSLRFSGSAAALSTSNAADYALSAGVARFTNNAGAAVDVALPPLIFRSGFETLVMR